MRVTCIEKSIQNRLVVWKFVNEAGMEYQIVDNAASYEVGLSYDATVAQNGVWEVNQTSASEEPVIEKAGIATEEELEAGPVEGEMLADPDPS